MLRSFSLSLLALGLAAITALAQDLPKGQIIDDVKCKADATQSYALYLPSKYSPDRKWNVILAFDPRGRGRTPVERFQEAAEKYGYIVAGSNNSRNGPPQISQVASKAMLADLQARFSLDPKRMYGAGQSGGSRFALDLALTSKQYAGVVAASAGFAQPVGSDTALDFRVFATAGTEDFNYQEMRRFDRVIASPHRLRIFNGDHTWLPSSLAVEALEWFEIEAMKTGLRPKDEALIDAVFASRKARFATITNTGELFREHQSLVADFNGLRDVKASVAAAAQLEKSKALNDAQTKEAIEAMNERTSYGEIANYADQFGNPLQRADSIESLKTRLIKLSSRAKAADDSTDRQMARRVIRTALADYTGPQADPELRKMLEEARP